MTVRPGRNSTHGDSRRGVVGVGRTPAERGVWLAAFELALRAGWSAAAALDEADRILGLARRQRRPKARRRATLPACPSIASGSS